MTESTLSRARQIEDDFYELKSQEFGPKASKDEIKKHIELAIKSLWDRSDAR